MRRGRDRRSNTLTFVVTMGAFVAIVAFVLMLSVEHGQMKNDLALIAAFSFAIALIVALVAKLLIALRWGDRANWNSVDANKQAFLEALRDFDTENGTCSATRRARPRA